jgi:hypothetical protein
LRDKGLPDRRLEILTYIAIFGVIVFNLFPYCYWRGYYPPAATPYNYRFIGKKHNNTYFKLNLPRAENVYVPPEEASTINLVVKYIKQETKPDEPIYVFPFCPMYYFLADRLSPVKYPVAHTVTKAHREEVLRKLDEEKVKLIVYKSNPPVQCVTTETRYPEINEYIFKNYEVEKEIGDTLILKRKESM